MTDKSRSKCPIIIYKSFMRSNETWKVKPTSTIIRQVLLTVHFYVVFMIIRWSNRFISGSSHGLKWYNVAFKWPHVMTLSINTFQCPIHMSGSLFDWAVESDIFDLWQFVAGKLSADWPHDRIHNLKRKERMSL